MASTITDEMIWMTTKSDDKNPQIVKGGEDEATRQTLYVGRATEGKAILPGKVYRGENGYGLYTAHGNKEHYVYKYEMLVTTKPVEWEASSNGNYPSNAIPGGKNAQGDTLYIARAKVEDDDKCPGYLLPSYGKCVYGYHGNQCEASQYDVLTEAP